MESKEKVVKFDDNSLLRIKISKDGKMSITLQARHLGEEIKFTSAMVELTKEETLEVVNWMGEELMNFYQ